MGAGDLAADGEAESGAAGAGRADEGAEQIVPGAGRQAVAVIRDLDIEPAPGPRPGAEAQMRGTGLDRVPRQIEQRPEQLVAIALDAAGLGRVVDAQRRRLRSAGGEDLVDQRVEREADQG